MEKLNHNESVENIPVVEFIYDRKKDVACLLEKGPGGVYSPNPTTAYKELVAEYGDKPTPEQASDFVEEYMAKNKINSLLFTEECKTKSKEIVDNFQMVAEKVFGIKIPEGSKAYLTVNDRCPYNIQENWFFASIYNTARTISTAMHELWHFYTWYKFGNARQESGEKNWKKYGDIKESLTVLLNSEYLDLLPEGRRDNGYPQHKELREIIGELWNKNPDIDFVWNAVWEDYDKIIAGHQTR